MKYLILLLFLSTSSLWAFNAEFTIEHLSKSRSLEDSRVQRTKAAFENEYSVNKQTDFNVYVEASQSFVNSNTYITSEEDDSLGLEVKDFSFKFNSKNLQTSIGVSSEDSGFSSVKNVNAPSVSLKYNNDSFIASTSYLNVPSSRRFFVQKSQDELAGLWSSYFSYNPIRNDFENLDFKIGYHYFHDLGSEMAYQSSLRGNTKFGNIEDADFEYDFSILCASVSYDVWLKNIKFISSFEASQNISTFTEESKLFNASIGAKKDSLIGELSLFRIERNSMISIFTDEIIDATDVEGVSLSSSYELSKGFLINGTLSRFSSIINDEDLSSIYMSLTFRK